MPFRACLGCDPTLFLLRTMSREEMGDFSVPLSPRGLNSCKLCATFIHGIYQEVMTMANLTLAIPEDLKVRMKRFPEINWSEVARQAISEKTRVLERMEGLLHKSTLTEEEAVEIGRAIKRRVWRRHTGPAAP